MKLFAYYKKPANIIFILPIFYRLLPKRCTLDTVTLVVIKQINFGKRKYQLHHQTSYSCLLSRPKKEQKRQSTYNAPLQRFGVTIATVEKQKILNIFSV
jgi:hypothetical protein